MKFLFKIASPALFFLLVMHFFSCKKNKLTTDSGDKVEISQDSVLFDTVFTNIGSATQNIRIRNKHKQKIKIASIQLAGGSASAFKVNVDGSPGTSFSDIEIAAEDSLYIFLQVNVNPRNGSSPFIIRDSLMFLVNGNTQKVQLEAWGQDAYYHHPKSAIKFKDGSFLPYSLCDSLPGSFTMNGSEVVWNNDKPHVIYGYCVVDEFQKLRIQAGTKIYMNNRSSLWVYQGGELKVLGQKGNEVIFQGVRREKEYEDKPGQWDRIWINEGSDNNEINYAIIKNGFIGVQAELFGDSLGKKGQLKLTNTKIQNMSKWGLYCFAYKVFAGNNVISNCLEHSVKIQAGGAYLFLHCTIANYWNQPDKARELPAFILNNYIEDPNTKQVQVVPLNAHFGNCVIDGKMDNELNIDVKNDNAFPPKYKFSSCLIKSTHNLSDTSGYLDIRKVGDALKYKDVAKYNFEPDGENQVRGFKGPNAINDMNFFPSDINTNPRNSTNGVTAGAYQD
jgi:hypothetical protein